MMTNMTRPAINGDGHASLQRLDSVPSGFTAVNGDGQKNSSRRSEDSSKNSTTLQEKSALLPKSSDSGPTFSQVSPHGWRANGRNLSEIAADSPFDDDNESRKRKRSGSKGLERESDTRPDQPRSAGAQSPKRRMTNIDSAIDLTSPQKPSATPAPSNSERVRTDSDASVAITR